MITYTCTCNKCGKEFGILDSQQPHGFEGQMLYPSKYDGAYIRIDLCVDCMDELIDSCKVKPYDDK